MSDESSWKYDEIHDSVEIESLPQSTQRRPSSKNYFSNSFFPMDILVSIGAIILGLVLLTLGGNLLVDGAVSVAKKW